MASILLLLFSIIMVRWAYRSCANSNREYYSEEEDYATILGILLFIIFIALNIC